VPTVLFWKRFSLRIIALPLGIDRTNDDGVREGSPFVCVLVRTTARGILSAIECSLSQMRTKSKEKVNDKVIAINSAGRLS